MARGAEAEGVVAEGMEVDGVETEGVKVGIRVEAEVEGVEVG